MLLSERKIGDSFDDCRSLCHSSKIFLAAIAYVEWRWIWATEESHWFWAMEKTGWWLSEWGAVIGESGVGGFDGVWLQCGRVQIILITHLFVFFLFILAVFISVKAKDSLYRGHTSFFFSFHSYVVNKRKIVHVRSPSLCALFIKTATNNWVRVESRDNLEIGADQVNPSLQSDECGRPDRLDPLVRSDECGRYPPDIERDSTLFSIFFPRQHTEIINISVQDISYMFQRWYVNNRKYVRMLVAMGTHERQRIGEEVL